LKVFSDEQATVMLGLRLVDPVTEYLGNAPTFTCTFVYYGFGAMPASPWFPGWGYGFGGYGAGYGFT
jgi:hypothetical protein